MPRSAVEVTVAEAIARALTNLVADKQALKKAWAGGAPLVRTAPVPTTGGPVEVTLGAPYQPPAFEFDPSADLIAELAALTRDDDEIDSGAREALEEELLRRFSSSAEAQPLDGIDACDYVMDLAASYLGETIATLRAPGLREVLFELVPRKVSMDAAEAPAVIEELRAFYAFLKREFGLKQADACLRVLGKGAEKELKAALSDPRNFGMAKSLFMAGADAGFDMHSKEGIDAWMRSVQGQALSPSISLPGLGGPPPPSRKACKANKATKAKRKAERKARRKNR